MEGHGSMLQGKPGPRGSTGKDGQKVNKWSEISFSKSAISIVSLIGEATKTNPISIFHVHCVPDNVLFVCLCVWQGEPGLPGLSLPGMKGEKVKSGQTYILIHFCPGEAGFHVLTFLLLSALSKGECGVCQPFEVGSGSASLKMPEGTTGQPGKPGPPGSPGPPGLGADGKQVCLLWKDELAQEYWETT